MKKRFFSKTSSRLSARYRYWVDSSRAWTLRSRIDRHGFRRRYFIVCLGVLLASTLLWSFLGARLQLANADSLVNPFLFQGSAFHQASLPSQHSFLIKWPLFYLVKIFGYSSAAFVALTMATCLATVGFLVYVLGRIERRPLVLGTICLGLASVLLMVPAQPYAGGLLPVNMAMLTTRNLEYIWYLAALWCLVRSHRVRSRRLLVGAALLALLVASDKLFLSVGLVGAALALLAYALRQRWTMVSLAARWLVATLVAAAGALIVLGLLSYAGVVHMASQNGVGPYSLTASLKDLCLGAIYAVGGMLTNFGANPAYDALTIRQLPGRLVHNLIAPGGPAYLINLLALSLAAWAALTLVLRSLSLRRQQARPIDDDATKLSVMLLWSSLAAALLFVATKHYYVVDARYLTISFFGLVVALAVWTRSKRLHPESLLLVAVLLALGVVSGSLAAFQRFSAQQTALAPVTNRSQVIAQTLANHKVDVLVGDYWRVLPAKLAAGGRQTVLPLKSCTEPRADLTSRAWQPDLRHHSFAYLLTFSGNLTDYPACQLQQVTKAYGLPNSSALVAGSLAQPQELLLFYDKGSHPLQSKTLAANAAAPATVLPINLEDLPHTGCRTPTIMQIVAHQDDDILFMSPDLLHDIAAGYCIRSVYLTAGDAGDNAPYWLAREQGSEAAYGYMVNSKDPWIKRIVKLPEGQFLSVANPRGNDRVSLIFMHLPDGGLKGDGFQTYHRESLAKLEGGKVSRMTTVDHQSSYSAEQLADGLDELLHVYQPAEIRTQSDFAGSQFPDHSDHRATGRFVKKAYQQYVQEQFGAFASVPLIFYMGYPVHELPPNIAGADLATKEAAFTTYGSFDRGVCHSHDECQRTPTYGSYLSRQYRNTY